MQPDNQDQNQNQPTQPGYQPVSSPQPVTPPQPSAPQPVTVQPVSPQPVQAYEQPVPGKVMGIVGLILSIFGLIIPFAIAGIILSIVARVKSSRAGRPSGIALAGIIIGIITLIIGLAIFAVTIAGLGGIVQKCQELGPGTHYEGGVTYNCGTTSTGTPQ